MKKALIVVIWIGLAIFNFGAINAQCNWEEQNRWPDLHHTRRDDMGLIVGQSCLVPPVEFFTSLLITNFLQHGWYLGDKDVREKK